MHGEYDPSRLSKSLDVDVFNRALDLAMLEFHNGKERDFDDWVELLGKADHRFHLVNMIQPPGSRLTVIEVGWSSGSQDAASESGIK